MKAKYNPSLGFNAMNCEFTAPTEAGKGFFKYNGQEYTIQMNTNASGWMRFRLNRNYDAANEKYYIRVENNEIKLRWITPTTQSLTYSNGGFRAFAWETWSED